jgi:proline iminopeptidase
VDSSTLYSFTEPHDGFNLTDEYHIVIWDQRGTGLSMRHDEPSLLTMAVYLKDLEDLVEVVAPGRQVILLGHSFGGMYATMYMNAHPDRIAGAILIEPGPLSTALRNELDLEGMSYCDEWLNDLMWARQFITMNDHERADYVMTIGYSDPYPISRVGAAVMAYLGREIQEQDYDYADNVGEIVPEILFIVGGDTEEMGEAFQHKQRALFPTSRLEVIPDSGHHDIVWSNTSQSVSIIREYLNTLDTTVE